VGIFDAVCVTDAVMMMEAAVRSFVFCPAYHPLAGGPSSSRPGITFTCDVCSVRNVKVAVSCPACAYDICRGCFYNTRASPDLLKEQISRAEQRVMDAARVLSSMRERLMDEECWV